MIRRPLVSALPLVAVGALLAAPVAARAGEISDTDRALIVTYDEAVWSATLREEQIDFACIASACGGEAAACNVLTVFTEPGADPRTMLGTVRIRLEERLKAMLPGVEDQREVLQDAVKMYKGDVAGVSAVLRATANGAAFLVSYFYVVQEADGVAVASCVIAEKDHALARPAFDNLMAGVSLHAKTPGGKL